jgi:Ca2+-binding EF-hand superfamily protein
VNTLYRHILGRQPDAAGARGHAQTVARQGVNSVIDAIVNSQEYNQQFGDWGVPGSGGMMYCGSNNQAANAAPAQRNANTRFRGMDDNNDGSITQDEWQGSRQSFRVHDWNNDGVLTGDEIANAGVRAGRTVDDEDFDRQDRFEYLDANNNGRIELREWHASDQAFHQLDRNGDNYLSRAESPAMTAPVATSGVSDLIYVDAKQRWTDTGIDLQAGQTGGVRRAGHDDSQR